MLSYLHHRNSKIFFHPAKFDNFKDETISDYKTVSVPQSQILAGLKTLGLVYSIVKDSSADLGVNSKIVQIRPTVKAVSTKEFLSR
jgi:hypothetical protein